MSSNSTSPSRTPSKRTMAVEKPARTPLPNGTSSEKPNGIVATALENLEKPANHIQVPSSQPPVSEVTVVKDIQNQNGHQNGHQNGQANEDHAPSSTVASDQDPGELPPFDWQDFRHRYGEELVQLNKDEEELVENFDKLAQSFTYWAESASNRDNTRGIKRLCTRERYVQLAEEALETKQQRYVQVVGAFKQALEMLRGNGL